MKLIEKPGRVIYYPYIMAASKLRIRIAGTANSKEILTAIPIFLESNYQIRIVLMLCDQTGFFPKPEV